MKKSIKRFFGLILFIIIGINLFIIISGRTYLYRAFIRTYFAGKMAPGISDQYDFCHRLVKASSKPSIWEKHRNYNENKIEDVYLQELDKYETVSFLVAKDGKLLHEEYFRGYTKDSITNSYSVVKTLIGNLIGIAIGEGEIQSVDQKVADFLPSFNSGGKEKITIKHLLTMSSGLHWIESGKNPLSHNAEAYFTTNLRGLIDGLEVEKEPGEYFEYLSGNTQVLGFILEKATGKSISEYASEKIWSKIGAHHNAWWMLDDEAGFEKAYCCFYATARDYLKLGQLYLDGGKWNGKRIIPKDFFEASIQPADLKTLNGDENKIYGYHIWLEKYKGHEIYSAVGLLGQYIIMIPSENLVVCRTGHKRGKKSLASHPSDFYSFVDAALALAN